MLVYLRDRSALTIAHDAPLRQLQSKLSISPTVYWHWANQFQHWPYNTRHLAGWPLECQFLGHLLRTMDDQETKVKHEDSMDERLYEQHPAVKNKRSMFQHHRLVMLCSPDTLDAVWPSAVACTWISFNIWFLNEIHRISGQLYPLCVELGQGKEGGICLQHASR